ncbi:MAG TPA: alpha/beta fold hydrolase [Rhizomicrobium sp.]|jgi:dipeptidyl aminopeptidase/acylaminoacyl peptidase|nr:alpha/beta fold hydrolase [Rhizomicrobium sp.]
MKLGLLLAAAAALAASSALGAAPPVEAFGSLPALTKVHLSPDGKYFSAIEPLNGRPTVVVFALDEPTKPIIFSDPETFAEDSTWVNNDRLICIVYGNIVENTKKGLELHTWSRAISVSVSGKDPVVLLKRSLWHRYNRAAANVVALDTTDPNVAYMSMYNENVAAQNYYSNDLIKVNVETGSLETVMRGTEDTIDWVMDGKGGTVARIDEKLDQPTQEQQDHLYLYRGDRPAEVATFDASKGWEASEYDLTEDGKALAIARHGDKNTLGLDLFPLDGTSFGGTLLRDPNYDISLIYLDDWARRVVGAEIDTDKRAFQYIDPVFARLQRGLEAALPGENVVIESGDRAGENYIISSGNAQNPRTYWLYNAKTHQLKALAQQYPGLAPADLGEMKAYPYKAGDGMDIHAYLTLPPASAGRNLPLVVLPHGGPEARDVMGFDWLAQFFVSRGYAVFQPNFRGSYGYGKTFTDAGNGQWGLKMQSDISDGVKKLIADGTADPKRICIVGASYGGYAALAGATFTPELYACAVSIAGISSVPNIIGTAIIETGEKSSTTDYWKERIGDISSDEPALDTVSPALHAANVRAPILLIHDSRDVTVPIAQSVLEEAALKKAGKSVQFITIDGDDHYLNLASTRIEALQAIEKFLAANIGR